MREQIGELAAYTHADAWCVPTNGSRRQDGSGVMGRGVAGWVRQTYSGAEHMLGEAIKHGGAGNVGVFMYVTIPTVPHQGLFNREIALIAFPTKHQWFDRYADRSLIVRSIRGLVVLADHHPGWKVIVLPRPGCGAGGLSWDDVRPLCGGLDDRFVITSVEER